MKEDMRSTLPPRNESRNVQEAPHISTTVRKIEPTKTEQKPQKPKPKAPKITPPKVDATSSKSEK